MLFYSRTPGSRQPSPAEEEGGVNTVNNVGVGSGGVGVGVGVRNGDAAAFPLLPPHALPAPQPQPLHHLPHLQHPQVIIDLVSIITTSLNPKGFLRMCGLCKNY